MRIVRSPPQNKQPVPGRWRSVWTARLRDRARFRERARLGRALMVASLALGLALLLCVGAYLKVWRPVLPRLRARLDLPRARANGLSTLRLDLEPGAYRALATQRQRAVRAGILLPADATWAPGRVHFKGRTIPVRVRLAGVPPGSATPGDSEPDGVPPLDHWEARKWSLEIEADGDAMLGGARALSLRSPATRGYLNAWLYAEALSRAGLPAPGYDADTLRPYVNLSLNGDEWGVYALEAGRPADPPALGGELLGRSLAHADLWGTRLPGTEYRPRHLADPGTPIVGPAVSDDPAVAEAYLGEAARISQPEYLRVLRRIYGRAFRRYHDALAVEFFPAYLQAPWDALAARQGMLSAAVQVGAFAPGGQFAPGSSPPGEVGAPPPVVALPVLDLIPAPSVEEALARHPFLRAADRPGFLQAAPGTWHVEGDLVLPEGVGLWAGEAVTLTFDRDAALVVRGPLALDGPEGDAIRLIPEGDHWGGALVYGAGTGEPSILRDVEVRGARGIERGGRRTVGGLTFVGMAVRLERCRVLDSDAAAAVHILGAPFELADSELGAATGDLLWVEGARGKIVRSAFHDAPGAALRLTGSEVDLWGVSALRVQGEAISARQGSALRAQGIRAREVGVAVAAIDGAAVSVRDVRVGRAATAGFVAYREGAGGPATLDATEVLFEDSSRPALAQEGSGVTIDGLPVETQALEAVDLVRPPQVSPPLEPLHVRFGPSIWLIGYQLTTPERAPGETVEVILYWRAYAPLDRQYTVFVHLLDASGEWVAGWDMMPRYNTYPTTDWPVVELIDDAHILPLSAGLPRGEYAIALGMYDWGTGERLPAYTRQGEEIAGAAVVLKETVTVK
jgi:hypothetical protein